MLFNKIRQYNIQIFDKYFLHLISFWFFIYVKKYFIVLFLNVISVKAFTQSIYLPCIHPSIHSFIHSFIHLFNYSFIHPFIHSCIHSIIHSFIHAFIHSFMHSIIHSCVHSFIHSIIHSFIHPFIHLFLFQLSDNPNVHTWSGASIESYYPNNNVSCLQDNAWNTLLSRYNVICLVNTTPGKHCCLGIMLSV